MELRKGFNYRTLYIYQSIPSKNVAVDSPELIELARLIHQMSKEDTPSIRRKVNTRAKKLGFKAEYWEGGISLSTDFSLHWIDGNGENYWLNSTDDINKYLEVTE